MVVCARRRTLCLAAAVRRFVDGLGFALFLPAANLASNLRSLGP